MTDAASLYLDYAASTPVDPRVLDTMTRMLGAGGAHGNPSSAHAEGRRAAAAVERAGDRLAALVRCDPGCLVWTSGATESDNLAIAGAAHRRRHRGRHLLSMRTEHKAVTDVLAALARGGCEVDWLEPGADGVLDPAVLDAAIRDDTQLVSVMHVNNETGVVQDIAGLGAICRRRGVLFHVDAAQSVGKLPIDLGTLPVDLMSMTAHKIYGPKGIGALYVAARPEVHIEPLLHGGGQQRRLRPGTLPAPQIAGFGRAAEIARESLAHDLAHVSALRDRLWAGIRDLAGIRVNGSLASGYPGILNFSATGVDGESLMLALEPLCVAAGSACNSTRREPSAVLQALGLDDRLAQSAVRFSFGRPTTAAEVDAAVSIYRSAVDKLRSLSPGAAA